MPVLKRRQDCEIPKWQVFKGPDVVPAALTSAFGVWLPALVRRKSKRTP